MNNMIKIMLVGKAGAGKTTIAKELEKHYGYKIFSFATRLKQIAEEIKMAPLDKLGNPKDRELLQKLGTEIGRWYTNDMWVKQLAKSIEDGFNVPPELLNGKTKVQWVNNIVIDDCRFLNEAKWGKENGFIIIRVVGRGYNLDPKLANHASEKEQELVEADYIIDNSGSLSDTMNALWNIIKSYS